MNKKIVFLPYDMDPQPVVPSSKISPQLSHLVVTIGTPAAYASSIVPGIPSVVKCVGNSNANAPFKIVTLSSGRATPLYHIYNPGTLSGYLQSVPDKHYQPDRIYTGSYSRSRLQSRPLFIWRRRS